MLSFSLSSPLSLHNRFRATPRTVERNFQFRLDIGYTEREREGGKEEGDEEKGCCVVLITPITVILLSRPRETENERKDGRGRGAAPRDAVGLACFHATSDSVASVPAKTESRFVLSIGKYCHHGISR